MTSKVNELILSLNIIHVYAQLYVKILNTKLISSLITAALLKALKSDLDKKWAGEQFRQEKAVGAFHSTKNSGLKFRVFHMTDGAAFCGWLYQSVQSHHSPSFERDLKYKISIEFASTFKVRYHCIFQTNSRAIFE